MIVSHKGIYPEEQRENTVCAREWQGAYTLLLDSMHGDTVGTRKSIRMCLFIQLLTIYLSVCHLCLSISSYVTV